jgi:hypothetical protein
VTIAGRQKNRFSEYKSAAGSIFFILDADRNLKGRKANRREKKDSFKDNSFVAL